MMNIFITGGGGFIGGALLAYLRDRYDYKLFAPSSTELNICDEAAIKSYVKTHKIDCIIHLANRGGGRDSLGEQHIVEYNLRMFFAIASCAPYVEQILHFGSGAEYSKHKPIVRVKEEEYLQGLPLDAYGLYKHIASRFIEAYNGNITALRIFGCYGYGENYRYKFISNAIVKTLFHMPITIYKDCLFDYVYIDDLMKIIDYFLHHKATHHIYNATSGTPIYLSELARLISNAPLYIQESTYNNEYTACNARLMAQIPSLTFTPHTQAIAMMKAMYEKNLAQLDRASIEADPYLARIKDMWQSHTAPYVVGGGGGKYLAYLGGIPLA